MTFERVDIGDDVTLYLGDCLEVLPTLEAGSVDAILGDIPYGTTACAWDEIIPFEPMWAGIRNVLKARGVFVTTASQPFTSRLIMSNLEWFKYEWIWDKGFGHDFQLANVRPLKGHENICVFGRGGTTYNAQKIKRNRFIDARNWAFDRIKPSQHKRFASDEKQLRKIYTDKYPDSVIYFNSQNGENNNVHKVHPTQKPVALYDYLTRTYTNEGDTVLDFTMGSGTTGVAAVQLGRRFIGVEIDPTYFKIAEKRIREAKMQLRLEI